MTVPEKLQMNATSFDARRPSVPWILCETPAVWRQAVHRFAVPWYVPKASIDIHECSVKQVVGIVRTYSPGVVLWGYRSEAPELFVQALTRFPASRLWLHVLVGEALRNKDRAVLSELNVTAWLSSIEDLPQLRRLALGHFARSARPLH